MTVMIGIDPHKGSHTAVAIDDDERSWRAAGAVGAEPGRTAVASGPSAFGSARWAVESAGGLGYLLAQQLVAAGEQVVDVPAKLAARVRLLATGRPTRTTPTTPGRWPSPRCAPRDRRRVAPRTTRR